MLARVVNGEFDKSALVAQQIIETQQYAQKPSFSLLGQAYVHSAWAAITTTILHKPGNSTANLLMKKHGTNSRHTNESVRPLVAFDSFNPGLNAWDWSLDYCMTKLLSTLS
jgi:hypothetical protein